MEDIVFRAGTDDEINEAAQALKKLQDELSAYKDELGPVKDELSKIHEQKDAAKQAYLAAVAQIVDRESELTRIRNERNNLIRQMQMKVASAERQLQQAQRIERIKAEEAKLQRDLDTAVATAKWFAAAFKHQFEAAKKITMYRRMILADAPGLGKTLTALAACDLIQAATANARPDNPYDYRPDVKQKGVPQQCGKKILYICPAPLIKNVMREVRLWSDRSATPLGKQPRQVRNFIIETLNELDEFVVIVNYEAWRRDKMLLADLKNLQFDTVILDEAHVLKDRTTGAYISIKSLLSHRNEPEIDMPEYNADVEEGFRYTWNKPSNKYVPFVIAMTGTPILNKPQDLFSLLSIVDPDHFTSETYFLRDYCQQNLYNKKWEFRAGGLESLAKRLSNLYLRRTKRDAGIVLPGKHEQVHLLELDKENYPAQAKARDEMKKYGAILLSADKTITAAAEIAIYTRLRQIETWPAGIEVKDDNGIVQLKLDVEESQKLDYVISKDGQDGLITNLCEGGIIEGSSCVVFSQFRAPLQELRKRCETAGISAIVLDGSTSESVRDEIIRDFDRRHTSDSEAKWQVVLANYRVGGVGVTLTRATELIMLDSEWSAGREEQATDRVHRIGQTEDVTIHKIMVDQTIDAWLDAIVEHKKGMTEGFNSAVEAADLRKYLME